MSPRQNFTTADRRAVLESLLQRDEVVAHLFHVLFPTSEIRPENTTNGHANFGPIKVSQSETVMKAAAGPSPRHDL